MPRALVISDTHLGAWTGEDLLSQERHLERLAPQLERIDELVILGDLCPINAKRCRRGSSAKQGGDS